MLAELITLFVVGLAVLGPGSYLLHVAWKRGGAARKLAVGVLVSMGLLVATFLSPIGRSDSEQNRIELFVGAWGILFMVVGALAIGAALVGKWRARKPPRSSS